MIPLKNPEKDLLKIILKYGFTKIEFRKSLEKKLKHFDFQKTEKFSQRTLINLNQELYQY
jgi:hypothetical protein